jgi:hypothetical protein
MKSVPGDFVIFDEVDEMKAANLDLARKRLGHSEWGWELMLSTPSLPDCGIDAAFADSDQRHWVLRCDHCRRLWCLEDEFLERHGSPSDPRTDICFIKGPPGAETLVCQKCGRPLDPALGEWLAKYARPAHGYHLSKLFSTVVSEAEKKLGAKTKPAALLSQYRRTDNPAEFLKSELGLPYLAIDGGLSMADLRACVGTYTQSREHRGCIMGVDQNEGLHIVVKWADTKADLVYTVAVHHEPHTNADFSMLDWFMQAFDVRLCVIDAQPGIHAARAFAKRHSGRVRLAFYGPSQNGLTTLKVDHDGTPTITISRTEAFDRLRDLYQKLRRRIPRSDEVVEEYMRQLTQIVRTIYEDPQTGDKRARWVRRGPDHFAHADCYAEMAIKALGIGLVRATVLGGDEW